jgi:hypothetical protein
MDEGQRRWHPCGRLNSAFVEPLLRSTAMGESKQALHFGTARAVARSGGPRAFGVGLLESFWMTCALSDAGCAVARRIDGAVRSRHTAAACIDSFGGGGVRQMSCLITRIIP